MLTLARTNIYQYFREQVYKATIIMDYNEKNQELFKMLKTHKYDEFIKSLNEIDEMDIIFDINVRDEQQNYFLTYAVTLNEPRLVESIIKKGARIDITNKNDESILISTIGYSYFEVLEILLKANKETIGISVIDMKDRNMKIPLHYAIEIQNMKAIGLLLEYGSNVNTVDKSGYNSLHMAIKSRSSEKSHALEICELIIPRIADVNARYNTGESALHMACNLQLVDIVRLLIKYGANVNVQDHSHEITPLHYSIFLNNKELIALLLKNNAEPNAQDIYGNTPLHYCIIENNFEVFMMLTQSAATKNIINLNVWNIDGETPLHLILKSDTENMNDYLEIMLDKSNLSIQDNDGNTCLYYLIKLDLWKKYKKYLIKKRLDIFTLNSKKEYPLDIVKKEEYNEFIDLVTDSYVSRLKSAGELWYDEWENICSKSFDDVTPDEVTILDKHVNAENFDVVCKSSAKKKIIDLIKKVRSGSVVQCYEKSFPAKRAFVCVNVTEGSKVNYCTFTGSTLDILVGLIFLLKKHKDTCATLTKNYSNNKDLCGFYKSIGIIMNSKCEFLNFEIVWVHQRLYLMDGFYDQFRKCLNSNVKFVIIPLGIEMREGSHAGYLIYDTKLKEVERFEPHGATTPPGLYYNPNLLDEILEARFKTLDENIKYIRPGEYIPKVGFQLFDINETKKRKIGDPMGFCALWCVWYVDMRLTYREFDRKKLVNLLIKTIKAQNISFRNMIRNYGHHIIEIRDKILQHSKMDINDWLNDQYTDVQINSVLEQVNKEVLIVINEKH